jgi:hypothetical protein
MLQAGTIDRRNKDLIAPEAPAGIIRLKHKPGIIKAPICFGIVPAESQLAEIFEMLFLRVLQGVGRQEYTRRPFNALDKRKTYTGNANEKQVPYHYFFREGKGFKQSQPPPPL